MQIVNWLGRRFVVKTFDDDPEVNVQEIRKLIDEGCNSDTREEESKTV